tara:strand:- start:1062 stop:1907 length:846 start_codon:yes stop_codon:yes gene_type:complete
LKNSSFKKIVLGTEVFSGSWGTKFSQSKIEKILECANNFGIKEIDTAPSYGNPKHQVEKLLGRALIKYKKNFKINTKFENKIIGSSKIAREKRLSLLKKSIENSLKFLKIDNINILFFHSGSNEQFLNDDMWEYLIQIKKEKIVNKLGLSLKHNLVKNNDLTQLKKSMDYNISCVSTVLNMFTRDSLRLVVPFCRRNKILLYTRLALAKGLLTEKYNSIDDFSKKDPRYIDHINTKKILIFKKNIKNLTAKKSILWSFQRSDKVILSFKNINQIKNIFYNK